MDNFDLNINNYKFRNNILLSFRLKFYKIMHKNNLIEENLLKMI